MTGEVEQGQSTQPSQPPIIYAAMAKAMAAIGKVDKGGHNKFDGYAYKTVDDVYAEVRAALSAAEVFLTLEIIDLEERERPTKQGTQFYASGRARIHFWAADGSSIATDVIAEATDRGDKVRPKWQSMAMKTGLIATFLLSDGEQRDTEQESPEFLPSQPAAEVKSQKRAKRSAKSNAEQPITNEQIQRISALQKTLGMSPEDGGVICKRKLQVTKQELTKDSADKFISLLENLNLETDNDSYCAAPQTEASDVK